MEKPKDDVYTILKKYKVYVAAMYTAFGPLNSLINKLVVMWL